MVEAILKKLAAIGINLLGGDGNGDSKVKTKIGKITGIKFSKLFESFIHFDNSTHVDNRTIVVINPDKLKGKQRRALQHLLPELLNDVGAIVEEKNSAKVEEVVEKLHDIHEVANKFKPIIPSSDIPLLNACIYLRLRFENGESIENLKNEIIRVYGTRGNNFANLCSAGYLETWFLPLYDELVRVNADNPLEAKSKFLVIYKTIVNELPWTEFVSARHGAEKIMAHIIEKMTRNIANGVRYMNVHGIGERNVVKILGIIPEIYKQIGAVAIEIDKDQSRIFVRLEIPIKISN